jgi:predicted Zn-dependent protease
VVRARPGARAVAWEERFGAAVLGPIEARRRFEDPDVRHAIDRIVERLAREPSPYRFRIVVLDDDQVNAFAAPGGHVAVYRGLLRALETPEALASVLAHEMEHVTAHHLTEALLQEGSLGLLLNVAVGADGSSSVAEMTQSLGRSAYSRAAEEQADEGAVRRLVRSGIDPGALPRFFETSSAGGDSRWATFLSTHPSPADRSRRLRALIARLGPVRAEPLLTAAEWQAMKQAVAKK